MKKFFGLCILVIVLVAISGCTQQAQPATPATTLPTTIVTTVVPTTEATAIPTTVPPATQAPVVTTVVPTVVTAVATPKPAMTPSTTITTIYIRNNSFVPQELMLLPGTAITWRNADSVVHTVVATGSSAGKFTSPELMPKAGTFSYTFGQAEGRFEYKDTTTNATGVIIIKKGESFYGNPTVSTTVTPTS